MEHLKIPKNYESALSLHDTQVGIKTVKDFFQRLLAERLNLLRVSAPLFVDPASGMNDNLNGIERPVSFGIKEQNEYEAQVVQSLANTVSAKDKEEGKAETRKAIQGVVDATQILQQLRMGALIVFERQTKLGEIVSTGTVVEAAPSAQLIANIFFNKAPLHDGGMIIREGQVYAAGCILPLTSNENVSAELGTRHRAALGMSENSDAVVVVVSEETGQISIAMAGKLTRNYNRVTLREVLERELIGSPEDASGSKRILGKLGFGSGTARRGE